MKTAIGNTLGCLVLFDLVQRDTQAFWQPSRGVNEDGLKVICCFVLNIYRVLTHESRHTNTLNTQTYTQTTGWAACHSCLSNSLSCWRWAWHCSVSLTTGRGFWEWSQGRTLSIINTQNISAQPWGKESLKQPLIHWHCTQTHTRLRILWTHTYSMCNHKLLPYTYTSTIHI